MYQFKEDYDRNGHFWFDKKLITNRNWSNMTKAGKAVYPVIASHRNNKTGEAFPSERTIAILAGRSDKIARQGIRDLEDFPGFKISPYTTNRGRKSRKFYIEKPPNKPGRAFPFYKEVIEAGLWCNMTPTAQALYPVMLHFGFFDPNIYFSIENDPELDEESDFYPNRKWDYCSADLDVLASHAGINQRSVDAALQCLTHLRLAEGLGLNCVSVNGWKIYIHPQHYYKRDFLNQCIAKKYNYLMGL